MAKKIQKTENNATNKGVSSSELLGCNFEIIKNEIKELFLSSYRAGQGNNAACYNPGGAIIHNNAIEKRDALIEKIRKITT